MNRKEILKINEKELLNLIKEKFGIKINGLEDTKNLSKVWLVVEELIKQGWRVDIIVDEDSKRVDGMFIDKGNVRTLFARYGSVPEFRSVTEGICKMALIILEEE